MSQHKLDYFLIQILYLFTYIIYTAHDVMIDVFLSFAFGGCVL